MNLRRPGPSVRRAFTLIEAIAAIVVLSILITPTVAMLRDSTTARVDATQQTRATLLAAAVLEQVEADVASSSSSLGMTALASSGTYLNTPGTGLVARMANLTSAYTSKGLAWALNVGPLVSADTTTTGDSLKDVYRWVSVSVSWTSARSGAAKTFTTGLLVTDTTP